MSSQKVFSQSMNRQYLQNYLDSKQYSKKSIEGKRLAKDTQLKLKSHSKNCRQQTPSWLNNTKQLTNHTTLQNTFMKSRLGYFSPTVNLSTRFKTTANKSHNSSERKKKHPQTDRFRENNLRTSKSTHRSKQVRRVLTQKKFKIQELVNRSLQKVVTTYQQKKQSLQRKQKEEQQLVEHQTKLKIIKQYNKKVREQNSKRFTRYPESFMENRMPWGADQLRLQKYAMRIIQRLYHIPKKLSQDSKKQRLHQEYLRYKNANGHKRSQRQERRKLMQFSEQKNGNMNKKKGKKGSKNKSKKLKKKQGQKRVIAKQELVSQYKKFLLSD